MFWISLIKPALEQFLHCVYHLYTVFHEVCCLTWRPEWDRTVSWPSVAPPRPLFPAAPAWVRVPLFPSGGRVCRSRSRDHPPPLSDWHARPTADLAGPRTATATSGSALSLPGWLHWIYLTRKMCNSTCYFDQKGNLYIVIQVLHFHHINRLKQTFET